MCKWNAGRLMRLHINNLEMVKYCVANECPINEYACAMLPKTVISSGSNTCQEAKRPDGNCLG